MPASPVKWGVVSTVKAEAREILSFAAHYLEAGAHRLFLYLDAPCPGAYPHLKAHPKIRVATCDEAYWRWQKRPERHQVRQAVNATRAYQRQAKEISWLLHCDVDEFLWSDSPPAGVLAALPETVLCARVRPIEALSGGDGTAFKAYVPPAQRGGRTDRLYPQFGQVLRGGFLSHVQGKLFVRTGIGGLELRIHNAFASETENPGPAELDSFELCHVHAADWDSWSRQFNYRLHKGSYRAELAPVRTRNNGAHSVHDLLGNLAAERGTSGLRAFYDEVCADSPGLRARLQELNLLKIRRLDLDAKRQKHFPGFG